LASGRDKENGQSDPPWRSAGTDRLIETPAITSTSPSRKSKKQVNYAESDDEDEAPFKPLSGNGRAAKRRRISVRDDSDSDDEFALDAATQAAMEDDEGMFDAFHSIFA
jgi:DNA mismatch repair protein MSH6